MRQKKLFKWEFREREKNPKLGTMSTDEKLGINSHLLEDNSINERIYLELVAKKPNK